MSERVSEPLPAQVTAELDRRRVRTFIGLVLGRLGPRARAAVTGGFLTLLVGEQTRSLFAVTFALTAHRFVTWIANPLAGRLSDKSKTPLGRRVPFMVAGLMATALVTAFVTRAGGYWPLVALLVCARFAYTVYGVPASAVTPEAFGSTRWIRAAVAVAIGGLVVGISIRVTVIATWDQADPSTWGAAYYLAAAYIAFAALMIALLVREAPAAQTLADRARHDHHPLAALRSVFDAPNAKVLLAGIMLAIAAGGAFERIYPLYVRDELGGGGEQLAVLGLLEAPIFCATLPVSWFLAGRLSRRQTAVFAGFAFGAAALAHFWVTELWQSVALLAFSTMFLAAAVISLTPLYLCILPRRGGLGERIGLIVAMTLVAGLIGSFASAIAYDLILRDYRVVWGVAAAFGLASGFTYLWVRVPPWATHANPRQMLRTLRRILWGRSHGRHLFRGELHIEDTDGTRLLEVVADELNPYTQRDEQTHRATVGPTSAPSQEVGE